MAVKPQDILNRLTEEDRRLADELEEYIDNKLITRFIGHPINITVSCNDRVFRELKKRYSNWNIKRVWMGYNEDGIEFSPSNINDDVR